MIILVSAENAFDEIQHPIMTKTLNKLGIIGTFLTRSNYLQRTYSYPPYLMVTISKSPTKIRYEAMMSTLFQHSIEILEVLANAIKQDKEIKGVEMGKENIKYLCLQMSCFLCR